MNGIGFLHYFSVDLILVYAADFCFYFVSFSFAGFIISMSLLVEFSVSFM